MLSGLVGSLLGVGSNLLGLGINQGNFDDQMKFAKYQYEDMKRRQNPVNQVKQLRAAGMNPAFAFGQGQAGMATGVSQPSPNPASPLDLGGLGSLVNAIDLNKLQGENIRSQTMKNEEETKGMAIDNLFKSENWKSLIYGRDSESWLKNQLSEAAKLGVEYDKNTLKFRVEQQRQRMALLQSQVAAQDLANHYFPFEKSEMISNIISQTFANYATGKSSLAMAHQNLMRLHAEVGSTPEERSKFWNATYDLLKQQKSESMSKEWQNVNSHSPLPFNRETREDYFTWRNTGNYKRAFTK